MNVYMPSPYPYPASHVPNPIHYLSKNHRDKHVASLYLCILHLTTENVMLNFCVTAKPFPLYIPVGFWPTVGAADVLTYWVLHLLQFSTKILPCNSDKCSRPSPDFICKPSMFWLTIYLTWPASINAFNAIWVLVGAASSNEILIDGVSPFSSNVQTPLGPRKSGIPAEVEIPAPVWNTTCLLAFIISAKLSHFSLTTSSSSNFYNEKIFNLIFEVEEKQMVLRFKI